MRKNVMKRGTVIFVMIASALALGYHFVQGANADVDTSEEHYEYYYNEEEQLEDGTVVSPEDLKMDVPEAPLIDVDTDPDSIGVLVNREYLLPEDYVPEDLTVPEIPFSFYGTYEKSYMRAIAARALESLFQEAQTQGYLLKGVSAYRSYERQKQIYDRNLALKGRKHTKLFSAKPGSSEHQTGLTIDVSSSSIGCALEETFGETEEGKWLAENCHKFGFIIRYPKGKEAVTGYAYEPWHIRYVGKNLAKYIYKKDLTLEEYYQTTTEDNKVAPEEQVQDTDVGAPEEPEMKTPPTRKPSYDAENDETSSEQKKDEKPKKTKKKTGKSDTSAEEPDDDTEEEEPEPPEKVKEPEKVQEEPEEQKPQEPQEPQEQPQEPQEQPQEQPQKPQEPQEPQEQPQKPQEQPQEPVTDAPVHTEDMSGDGESKPGDKVTDTPSESKGAMAADDSENGKTAQ